MDWWLKNPKWEPRSTAQQATVRVFVEEALLRLDVERDTVHFRLDGA